MSGTASISSAGATRTHYLATSSRGLVGRLCLWSLIGAFSLLALHSAHAQVPCCMDPEDRIEESIEEGVTEDLEESAEEEIEQSIEDSVAGAAEENIEDNIEQEIEASLEENVQESVEKNVEKVVESALEDSVESDVESAVEESVEQVVESSVEDSVEGSLEVAIEDSVEGSVEDSVEDTLEQSVESDLEDALQDSVEVALEESVEETLEQSVEQGLEGDVERDVEAEIAAAIEDRLESEIDEIIDEIENKFEIDETRIHTAQWLVMAEPEAFEELAKRGYLFDKVTELPGMGLRLAEVAAPSSFKISEVRQGVVDVVGTDRADVDLNHFYTAGSPISHTVEGVQPRNAVPFPADVDELSLRIGMIDSQVDTSHPALASSQISAESFVGIGEDLPSFHGTAIASILVASGADYQGLAPRAQLYAAGVFEQDSERGEVASTVSLVRALDWLVSSGVDVVNLSLAGPANRLLETALNRAAQRGVLILAAAGNGGPAARPMYPAAYSSVVAVTAVDTRGRIFRLANRGDYLDLAAPGVGLLHAKSGGGYATSSGTSFAVPFATTAAARLRLLQPEDDVLESLYRSAEDLGPPGWDEIYGYGLLRPMPLLTSDK
ncbi:S8 family serine peptidase [Parahaliea sp. F7430]|uniref:S8 family serine peptidase n=1 Tax=Sediminihaliea albiluteola TaxID=2758564 RepID=A0A7W2TXH1_9GAMM|nr:S8 family serine peptidase [Sediminihaliea albiluteola]MBA6413717.1 S8 family serine peptidase [Sediminihaliea albiluteola]